MHILGATVYTIYNMNSCFPTSKWFRYDQIAQDGLLIAQLKDNIHRNHKWVKLVTEGLFLFLRVKNLIYQLFNFYSNN